LLFQSEKVRDFPPDIQRPALRKLAQLQAVTELMHLRIPPGNRLQALKGKRSITADTALRSLATSNGLPKFGSTSRLTLTVRLRKTKWALFWQASSLARWPDQ
jgi:hypothetical protein